MVETGLKQKEARHTAAAVSNTCWLRVPDRRSTQQAASHDHNCICGLHGACANIVAVTLALLESCLALTVAKHMLRRLQRVRGLCSAAPRTASSRA